jgi:AcrR family transcriptional regulator
MDVRDQILAEATRQFAARGFDSTPLADIAEAVGIRKPSLLYHFSSKAALRRGVLEKITAHWSDMLPRLLKAATSGLERFDAVLEATIVFFREDPDRARLVVREVLDRPDEIQAIMEDQVRSWVDLVSEYIRRGQKEGRIYGDVDPRAYIVHVLNLVIGGIATYDRTTTLLAGDDADGSPLERLIREMMQLARRGLFVLDPPPDAARPGRGSTP